eukprot:6186376-Pleurochrysis_carterae.AAC.1
MERLRHERLRREGLRHERSLRHERLRHERLRHERLRHERLRHERLRHECLRHEHLRQPRVFAARTSAPRACSALKPASRASGDRTPVFGAEGASVFGASTRKVSAEWGFVKAASNGRRSVKRASFAIAVGALAARSWLVSGSAFALKYHNFRKRTLERVDLSYNRYLQFSV